MPSAYAVGILSAYLIPGERTLCHVETLDLPNRAAKSARPALAAFFDVCDSKIFLGLTCMAQVYNSSSGSVTSCTILLKKS